MMMMKYEQFAELHLCGCSSAHYIFLLSFDSFSATLHLSLFTVSDICSVFLPLLLC